MGNKIDELRAMTLKEFNSWDPVGLNPEDEADMFEEYSSYADRVAGFLFNNRGQLDASKGDMKKLISSMMKEAFDISNLDSDALEILASNILTNAKNIMG